MKVNELIGERFKERPSDCVIDSHALCLRGGYMKAVGSGLFSQYPPLRRITRKIEGIIREEMDAIGGQEVLLPVVLPAALWEESGRYASVGRELLRMEDRNHSPLVLGMTHEEAAVHLVRDFGRTYTKYPFMIYQIQTKFRDEARPRGGLIRVREFTMKDAYSFHTSQEDLERYYQKCFQAYERIFARVGLPEVLSVASDSGMMGGSVSHEFMLLTSVGEDSIALCPACGYRANLEAAAVTVENAAGAPEALRLVETPNIHTIEDICAFLGTPKEQSCKAVVYQRLRDGAYLVLFLRGDLEVNEAKLTNLLGEELCPANITPDSGLHPGFIGPVGLKGVAGVLFDRSLKGAVNLSCGGNREGRHYVGLTMERDCPHAEYYDLAKIREGDVCPDCGQPSITISRGIEVGNIFQLGAKYTAPMGMRYLDENGVEQTPVMGCYGIGVERLAASICEARHDEYGPIWPMAVAPWQVHLCCVRADHGEARQAADMLYENMRREGLDVLYDDRSVSAGVMFSDADLLGVPLRVIVSPRNLKDGCCEVAARDKSIMRRIPMAAAVEEIHALVSAMERA